MNSARVSKAAILKMEELELLNFDEMLRTNDERQQLWDDFKNLKLVGRDVELMEKLQAIDEIPWFTKAACTREVHMTRDITEDGVVTTVMHYEWCPKTILQFRAGVDWAIANGLEVPDEFLKEGQ